MIVPAALLAVASTASAQIQINEIVINPPGADNGREYVELRATGPVSIPSGLHLLQIDGDGTSAGVIDFAWDLSTATFGSNGLLLRRDSAAVLNPAPEAGTNVIVQDFAPDLENGSATWLLVGGFSGAVGLDLDADNDGAIDNISTVPWTSIFDGIGYFEESLDDPAGQADEFTYADDFSLPAFPSPLGPTPPNAADSFTPDIIFRLTDGEWIAADLLDPDTSDPNNPLVYADVEIRDINNNTVDLSTFDAITWTPGTTNPTRTIAAANMWNTDADGDWSAPGNWSAGTVPNDSITRAKLGNVITAPRTITLSSAITINELQIDSANSYSVAGNAALSFAGTSNSIIDVTQGSHSITAPVNISKSGTINITAGQLTISDPAYASGVALSKTGAGVLAVKNVRADGLDVSAGVVRTVAGNGAAGVSRVVSFTQSAGSTLDLSDSALAIDYDGASPIDTIRSAIISGRAGGAWTGTGITASSAVGSPTTGLGYAEASAVGGASMLFSEVTTDATTVLIAFTVLGDANLDRTVNLDDFTSLAAGFGSGTVWSQGDFNYDGNVNLDDFTSLAANFGSSLPTEAPRAAVPEPTTAVMFAAAACGLLARRRRVTSPQAERFPRRVAGVVHRAR